MKFKTRLTALLLTLSILLACLISCASGNEPEETLPQNQSENISEAETEGEVNQFETPSSFDIIVGGEAAVKIIRPQNLSSGDSYVDAAIGIRNSIESSTGVRLTMGDDFKKATESYDDSTVEILVGTTQHAQVAEATAGLGYGDYVIKAVGNKIVIFGYTDEAVTYAAEAFADIVAEYKTEENGTVSVSIPAEALNIAETHSKSKALNAVPVFKGTEFVATSTSDEKVDQIILEDATAESYAAYLAELEAAGYKKYTDNDINGTLFATLYNDEYTLNIGYYKPYDECRILIEPFEEKTLIGLESDNKYTAVTTSQITMLGCEFKESSGTYKGNGLSLLYRLSDGSFVIVDGGHDTNSSYWSNNLINAITEQAKGYASGKDIRIAAWFVSHAHGDHMGMLKKEAAQFAKKFTVERVIANLMSDEEISRSLASSYGSNFGGGEANTTENVRKAAKTLGAELIQCHPGQRFYFADTVFEILYTSEMFAPSTVNALNTSSILVRSITTDASGKSTSVMVMGDVTGPAMAICNKLYGTNLRCEIVQVAHHGYQTWGNDSAMISSYKLMSSELVLWPMGLHAYETYKEKAYNKVLWDGTNKNLQGVYVAGWNNTQHTVPLPWNGDTASIVSKITKEK
ncbi:MAG: hypothetical protein J6S71_00225 [Clostridia bacterium]|nr:hypothetical protein [Clostridia bacterium]